MSEFYNVSVAFINDIVIPIAESALNLEFYGGLSASTFLLGVPLAIWLFETVFR